MVLEDGFADIIGKARFGKGWSLFELANRSMISESRIADLEAEARPSASEVASIGAPLDLDVKKLQVGSDLAWAPNLKPPYVVDPGETVSNDMVHVIDGKIGSYPVNGYLFTDWKSRESVLFDTGYSPDKVIAFLEKNALRLVAICLTHAHPDHIGGIKEIQSHSDAPVYLHRDEIPGNIGLKRRILVKEKMAIALGRFTITARLTPGHTDGGTSYFIDSVSGRSKGIAFVGDALFAGSIGRAKSPGSYPTLLNSVKNIILSSPSETLLFPGHGPVTTVGAENANNPFFK